MIVIRLFYNRDTVRINGNGQSDSSMNCCLHLRPESKSKTCKGDSNYRIQLDMVAALMTAGAGAQGWAPGGEGGTRKSSQQGWGDRGRVIHYTVENRIFAVSSPSTDARTGSYCCR